MGLSLEQSTALCRTLGDASRLRLLAILEQHTLTSAELTATTGITQSRVSTHLARLARAGLIRAQRAGNVKQYRAIHDDGRAARLWRVLREQLDDAQTQLDLERARQIIRHRRSAQTWAESVAGRMERHYSPGRTWEATARALVGLTRLGRVLDLASGDGVLAELIATHATEVTCLDISEKVVRAAKRRLQPFSNIHTCCGDMHAPPFAPSSFDQIFLMHALSYTREPNAVLEHAAPLLRPGGTLVIATLNAHRHQVAMEAYDHVNLGMTVEALRGLMAATGLRVAQCEITSREIRPPYFEVITGRLERPGTAPADSAEQR
ncbi:MAG TPA: ArsR family transcriptional regulator [Nevskiaceae bacterium]